ncbi:phage tail fiber protein [Massilia rhizosphaerae]|uniref:phage tail fiber protein n=1 Tax=Massilia rhizosphaerae TaxID=2784389 RepID=UPI0018DE0BCB|nr:hypothetical protein [Massilia rhizosphaerae]
MSGLTDYAQNKVKDALWRGQALGAPATAYFALITASRGERANSTAYALNDTAVVKIGSAYSYYKCTTAGTSAASIPGTYVGAIGEAITDGTAVFTEQTAALDAGSYTEVSGGSYARVGVTASLANFSGTQGAGTTTASSGTNGTTSNNVAITYPAPTGQWHPSGGAVVGQVVFDASTGGNPWHWSLLSAPKNVNNGDAAPSVSAGAWVDTLGN